MSRTGPAAPASSSANRSRRSLGRGVQAYRPALGARVQVPYLAALGGGVLGQLVQQRRLADAGRPADEEHPGAALRQQVQEGGAFGGTADEPRRGGPRGRPPRAGPPHPQHGWRG
jgi:hypothetical protein